jgi:hypothetical protein
MYSRITWFQGQSFHINRVSPANTKFSVSLSWFSGAPYTAAQQNRSDKMYLLSTGQEKISARKSIYAHAQDFEVSDELLLAILKAFVPQPLNEQQTIGFHVF